MKSGFLQPEVDAKMTRASGELPPAAPLPIAGHHCMSRITNRVTWMPLLPLANVHLLEEQCLFHTCSSFT
jgi:hypothetical protein